MFEPISIIESLRFITISFLTMFIIGDVMLSFLKPKITWGFQNDTILDFFIIRIALGIAFIMLFSEIVGTIGYLNESLIAITFIMLILFSLNLFSNLNKMNIRKVEFYKAYIRNIISNKKKFLNEIISILSLILLFFFSSSLITGFYGSTGGDQDFHTTLIYLIRRQNKIPIYGKPYYDFVISYPIGYHLFANYLSLILQIPLYKIVLLTSILMPIFTFLASYYLTKKLFNSTIMGLISGFASLCLEKPMAVFGWGGYPFGVSLFYTLISIALSPYVDKKITLRELLVYGMFLYSIIVSHVLEIIIVILWYLIYFIIIFFRLLFNTFKGNQIVASETREKISFLIRNVIISLSIMLILSSSTLFRQYVRFITPNEGYPSEVTFYMPFEITLSRIAPLFDFDLWNIASFNQNIGFTYASLTYYVFITPLLFIVQRKKEETIYSLLLLSLYMSMVFLIRFVIVYHRLLSKYLPFFIVEYLVMICTKPVNVLPILLINLLSIILASPYLLYNEIKKIRVIEIDKHTSIFTIKMRINMQLIIFLIIVMQAYFPFINIFIVKKLYGFYVMRENLLKCNVLAKDDLELIYWISKNLPENATIVVYLQDSGHYILPLADRKIIYPNVRLMYSYYYLKLIDLLSNNPSDPTILFLMERFNSSYIYIGSTTGKYYVGPLDFYYPKPLKPFNYSKFSESPFFKLVYRSGNAFLFQLVQKERFINRSFTTVITNGKGYWITDCWGNGTMGVFIHRCNISIINIRINNNGKCITPIIKYEFYTPQNWNNKSFLAIWWYGNETNEEIGIFLVGSSANDFQLYTFSDSFNGWRRVLIPLHNPIKSSGNFTLSDIKRVIIAFFFIKHPASYYIGQMEVINDP